MPQFPFRSSLALMASLVLTLGAAQIPSREATDAELTALRDSLIRHTPAGSTARVDPATGQVLLQLAGTASAELKERIARNPGWVRTEQVAPAVVGLALYGGHGITARSGGSCTAGFNAYDGVKNYVITAGHCTAGSQFWERKNEYLGYRDSWAFNEDGDFGTILVKGVHMSPHPRINMPGGSYREVGGVYEPYWGQRLCFMGNVSQLRCGNITAFEQTVYYGREGVIVNGLIETTICATNGDSGGPLFTPVEAAGPVLGVGIFSGFRDVPCGDPTYRSWFQPLPEILTAFSLTLSTV